MARTTYVAKARETKNGTRPTCHTCHKPIEVGEAYASNQPNRYSRKFTWHQACPAPRPSELESNEKRATAMAAFEGGYDELENMDADTYTDEETLIDDLKAIMDTVAEGVREGAEGWRESASNIEDGFGHSTWASDEMNDHADTYDGVADEVDQVVDNLDEYYAAQWTDFAEWVRATIEAAGEGLGDAEGGLD